MSRADEVNQANRRRSQGGMDVHGGGAGGGLRYDAGSTAEGCGCSVGLLLQLREFLTGRVLVWATMMRWLRAGDFSPSDDLVLVALRDVMNR